MRNLRIRRGVDVLHEQGTRNAAFYMFCAFIVSYFGRLTARMHFLGQIHFDLILAVITLIAIVVAGKQRGALRSDPIRDMGPVARRLWILLGYIVATIPFVQWPGSVIHNLEGYSKAVCFFFFVVATVDTTAKLRTLLAVWTATQVWRVLEPLYMHLTSGYWGDIASLGNWEYMDRLSGSPYDIINPNGLGFVIIMTLPLLHFLIKPDTLVRRVLWVTVALAMVYALVLSASRSGFLAFVFLCLFAIWRSKHRVAWLTLGAMVAVLSVGLMTTLQRDRYISIFSHDAPGGVTAETRITGVIGDFKISLRRPLFGHGLGTSREANANYRGADMPSHNLYTETAEELGYVGLVLVLQLIWSFLAACWRTQQIVSAAPADDERLKFLRVVALSLVAVVAVDLFFSFAAFGLSEPYWYFIGGLSVATARLAAKLSPAAAAAVAAAENQRRVRRGARPLRPLRGTRRGTAAPLGTR
jgi:putative inorganic carbon (hco3(-)) transporter